MPERTRQIERARAYAARKGWTVADGHVFNGTCGNSWSRPLPDLDAAVLGALREDVLTPDLIDDVVTRAVELTGQQHAGLKGQHRAIEADLRHVERELARFVDAIASGDPVSTLVEALRTREQRRADLKAKLERLDGLARTGRPTVTSAARDRCGPASSRGMRSWVALRPRPGRSCACS